MLLEKVIMLKRSMIGVAMGLALVATTAPAQSTQGSGAKANSFGLSAGLTVPTGDFGNGFKSGYNISALYEYHKAATPVAFRLEGQFQDFSAKGGSTETYKTFGGLANALFYLPTQSTVKPYLTGGIGFFNNKFDLGSDCTGVLESCSSSENKFGFDLGGGLEFELSGMSTFLEADWQLISLTGASAKMIPIRFGVRF